MNIKIPTHFMGKPIAGSIERVLSQESSKPEQSKESSTTNKDYKSTKGFIYVPSIGLEVSEDKTFHNHNWYDCHKELQSQGLKMLTLSEKVK